VYAKPIEGQRLRRGSTDTTCMAEVLPDRQNYSSIVYTEASRGFSDNSSTITMTYSSLPVDTIQFCWMTERRVNIRLVHFDSRLETNLKNVAAKGVSNYIIWYTTGARSCLSE
jgi:hypothetical protein